MEINLAIDDELIEFAKEAGNHLTKEEAVTAALQAYIRSYKQREIIELFGTLEYDLSYDYRWQRKKV